MWGGSSLFQVILTCISWIIYMFYFWEHKEREEAEKMKFHLNTDTAE